MSLSYTHDPPRTHICFSGLAIYTNDNNTGVTFLGVTDRGPNQVSTLGGWGWLPPGLLRA